MNNKHTTIFTFIFTYQHKNIHVFEIFFGCVQITFYNLQMIIKINCISQRCRKVYLQSSPGENPPPPTHSLRQPSVYLRVCCWNGHLQQLDQFNQPWWLLQHSPNLMVQLIWKTRTNIKIRSIARNINVY